jgi:hypothetical protein
MLLNPQINDHPLKFKNGNNANGRHHRRRRRRQVLHGRRQAALRAFHAARLVLQGYAVLYAAMCCGSNKRYVEAMVILVQSENTVLLEQVLTGHVPVLQAAESMKNAAAAITALKKCSVLERELVRLATGMTSDPVTMLLNLSPGQLVATSNALGLDWVWDRMISAAMPASESAPTKSAPAESVRASSVA